MACVWVSECLPLLFFTDAADNCFLPLHTKAIRKPRLLSAWLFTVRAFWKKRGTCVCVCVCVCVRVCVHAGLVDSCLFACPTVVAFRFCLFHPGSECEATWTEYKCERMDHPLVWF